MDPDEQVKAAEHLVQTFYVSDDRKPSVMSHDQAIALATAHALLAIAGRLEQIGTALTNRAL